MSALRSAWDRDHYLNASRVPAQKGTPLTFCRTGASAWRTQDWPPGAQDLPRHVGMGRDSWLPLAPHLQDCAAQTQAMAGAEQSRLTGEDPPKKDPLLGGGLQPPRCGVQGGRRRVFAIVGRTVIVFRKMCNGFGVRKGYHVHTSILSKRPPQKHNES
jgi:hypothetical protein